METFFNSNVFFYLAIIIGILGRAWDMNTSRNFIYYAGREAIPFNRDKYGFFSIPKGLLTSALFILPAFGLRLISELGNHAGVLPLVVGILSFIVGTINWQKNKSARKLQIETLRRIRDGESIELMNLAVVNAADRTFYWRFGWIYSSHPDREQALLVIRNGIYQLAKRPESEWFPG